MTADAIAMTPENPNKRKRLIRLCFLVGFIGPALCWLSVLLGATRADYPHDKVAVLVVMLSVYAPLLVFVNNRGEKRTLDVQLIEFAWLVFFSNVGYQFFWEQPWFLLKETLMSGVITEADVLFWPWWAYGVADTRYLAHNDLIISISAMDGSVALLEVICVVMFFKGYRVAAGWMAFLLTIAMGWGQYFFYISEIYLGFSGIEDGAFGLWVKYIALGFAWLVFPFFSAVGFIWHYATIYKKRALAEVEATGTLQIGQSFVEEAAIWATTDDLGDPVPAPANDLFFRRLFKFGMVWPFAFLLVDMLSFHFG